MNLTLDIFDQNNVGGHLSPQSTLLDDSIESKSYFNENIIDKPALINLNLSNTIKPKT